MDGEINIRKYKLFKFLGVGLSILLTLIGTVSILSLLMFLNTCFNVGFFFIFILSILLPQLYSVIVNYTLLEKIDSKINKLLLREKVLKKDDDQINISLKDNVECRYDCLSRDNKLKLLYIIRNDLNSMSLVEQVNVLNEFSNLSMEEDIKIGSDYVYSRKRIIEKKFSDKREN